MTDEDIDTSDIPEVGKEFFETAELWVPPGKAPIVLAVDEEVLDWFEEQGSDYQRIMNNALREYADARR